MKKIPPTICFDTAENENSEVIWLHSYTEYISALISRPVHGLFIEMSLPYIPFNLRPLHGERLNVVGRGVRRNRRIKTLGVPRGTQRQRTAFSSEPTTAENVCYRWWREGSMHVEIGLIPAGDVKVVDLEVCEYLLFAGIISWFRPVSMKIATIHERWAVVLTVLRLHTAGTRARAGALARGDLGIA